MSSSTWRVGAPNWNGVQDVLELGDCGTPDAAAALVQAIKSRPIYVGRSDFSASMVVLKSMNDTWAKIMSESSNPRGRTQRMANREGDFLWGDYVAHPNGRRTHDGNPLYDLIAVSLWGENFYDQVYIDDQFYPYDATGQVYPSVIPGRVIKKDSTE